MQIVLISFVFFMIAMAGMAIGVMAGRKALRGSCGGLNLADGTRIDCDACARPEQCPRRARHQVDAENGES